MRSSGPCNRDDPRFAGSVNIGAMRRHRRLVAAAVVLIGVLVLVVGAVLAQGPPPVGVAVSVLGFVVMVAGAGLFLRGRPGSQINAADGDAHPAAPGGPGWRTVSGVVSSDPTSDPVATRPDE